MTNWEALTISTWVRYASRWKRLAILQPLGSLSVLAVSGWLRTSRGLLELNATYRMK